MTLEESFIGLIKTALHGGDLVKSYHAEQWLYCYEHASRQGLLAFLFPVVQKFMHNSQGDRIEPCFSEWLYATVQTEDRNKLLNIRAEILERTFASWGLKSCVLKGQGVAQLYPNPNLRQSGDIDIWVKGGHNAIIDCLKRNCIGVRSVDYVHSEVSFFSDAEIEVHFRPSWMYNPFANRRLQSFFRKNAEVQFENKNEQLGFSYPTVGFNLVYSLIHINRHVFEEGIGLRQLLDYYYILKHSNADERATALKILCGLSLKKFACAIMCIEKEIFGLDESYLLCVPKEKEGKFLLEEIMRGGNFGRFDDRNEWYDKDSRLNRGLFHLKRNWRYLKHYPSEVMWIPIWSLWHLCWRKQKGYL